MKLSNLYSCFPSFLVVVFQYSSSYSVSEVTKEDFNKCDTSNALGRYSNGNSTIKLTKPGSRYFVCGNKLYCLGGMKLQVNVEGNEANAPAAAPHEAVSGGSDQEGRQGLQNQGVSTSNFPNPSSKTNLVTSSAFNHHAASDIFVFASLGLVASILSLIIV